VLAASIIIALMMDADVYRYCRGACCLLHQGQFGSLLFITNNFDCVFVRKDFCHLYSETNNFEHIMERKSKFGEGGGHKIDSFKT
jgi:hypothetical protein